MKSDQFLFLTPNRLEKFPTLWKDFKLDGRFVGPMFTDRGRITRYREVDVAELVAACLYSSLTPQRTVR